MKLIVLFFLVILGIFKTGFSLYEVPNYDTDMDNTDYSDVEGSKDITDEMTYDNNVYSENNKEPPEVKPYTAGETTLSAIQDCQCAVFDTMFPKNDDIPILIQVPSYIECENDGEEACLVLCTILAKSAMNHGPEIICFISNYKILKASVHSRVLCDPENDWVFTGLIASEDICCLEHRVVNCTQVSHEENNHKNNKTTP